MKEFFRSENCVQLYKYWKIFCASTVFAYRILFSKKRGLKDLQKFMQNRAARRSFYERDSGGAGLCPGAGEHKSRDFLPCGLQMPIICSSPVSSFLGKALVTVTLLSAAVDDESRTR